MSPYRPATEKQLAALTKARAALAKKHTCEHCGCEDPARGLQKHSDYRIYETLRDGEKHRYCISCRTYFRWIDARLQIEAQLQALFERLCCKNSSQETTSEEAPLQVQLMPPLQTGWR